MSTALAAALGDDLRRRARSRRAAYLGRRRGAGRDLARGRDAAGPAGQGSRRAGRAPGPTWPWWTRADGDRLQKALPPGGRLVSQGGRPVALGRLHRPRRRAQARRRPPGAEDPAGRGRGRDREAGAARQGRAADAKTAAASACAPPTRPLRDARREPPALEQRCRPGPRGRWNGSTARPPCREARAAVAGRPDRPLRGRAGRGTRPSSPPSRAERPAARASRATWPSAWPPRAPPAGPAREAAAARALGL